MKLLRIPIVILNIFSAIQAPASSWDNRVNSLSPPASLETSDSPLQRDPLLDGLRKYGSLTKQVEAWGPPWVRKDWTNLWPLLKQHLLNVQSPVYEQIQHLQGGEIEPLIRGLDEFSSEQWLWFLDYFLERFKQPTQDRDLLESRMRELQLSARLLYQRLTRVGAHSKETVELVERYRDIIKTWHIVARDDRFQMRSVRNDVFKYLLEQLTLVGNQPEEWRNVVLPRTLRLRSIGVIEHSLRDGRLATVLFSNHQHFRHTSRLSLGQLILLGDLKKQQQEQLLEQVLPHLLLSRATQIYTPTERAEIDYEYDNLGVIAELWEGLSSLSQSTREAFYAVLAREPLEKTLNPLLELAADFPSIRTKVLEFIVILLNLQDWRLGEQEMPWMNLTYLVNKITNKTDFFLMREVMHHCLKQYPTSGEIGISAESEVRVLSRPLEDPNSIGPDLDGFIRREAHRHQGTHVPELMAGRFHWWLTGDDQMLIGTIREFGLADGEKTIEWLKEHPRQADPVLQTLWTEIAVHTGEDPSRMGIEKLAEVNPQALEKIGQALKKRLTTDEDQVRLNHFIERGIPVYRFFLRRYSSQTIELAVEAVRTLNQKQGERPGWPKLKLEAFVLQYTQRDWRGALSSLAGLHAAITSALIKEKDFPKWTTNHEYYERELQLTQEIHHGVLHYRGIDPNDLNFKLYVLLERLRPLEQHLAGEIASQVKEGVSWQDLTQLLWLCSRWCQSTGLPGQEIGDLRELLNSPAITLGRLRLINRRIHEYQLKALERLDVEMGETIDTVATALKSDRIVSDFLKAIQPTRSLMRIRTHLERRLLLAARTELKTLDSVFLRAKGLLDGVKASQLSDTVWPRRESDRPTLVSLEGGFQTSLLEQLGEKGRSLLIMHQLGIPVPPASLFVISASDLDIEKQLEESVKLIEQQIIKRRLQSRLGSVFGDSADPLLVSVRGGSPVFDLPGALPTVTNIGINTQTIEGLSKRIGEWGAWDSYRRFIEEFALTVYGLEFGFTHDLFDEIIENYKRNEAKVGAKRELTAAQMKEVTHRYLARVNTQVKGGIPEDPWKQLKLVTQSISASWNWQKVREMREYLGIEQEPGSALIVQAMVHGNFSREEGLQRSGAGILLVPQGQSISSPVELRGSFSLGDEGSDIANGVVFPEDISVLAETIPQAAEQLVKVGKLLSNPSEGALGDLVQVEYTIQNGELWGLQSRVKRPRGVTLNFQSSALRSRAPLAQGIGLAGGALRGLLISEEWLDDPQQMEELHRMVEQEGIEGLIIAMDAASADKVPMLRRYGIVGFITRKGGIGEHSEEVASMLGLTAIAGVRTLRYENGVFYLGDTTITPGAMISMDGVSGKIYRGEIPLDKKSELIRENLRLNTSNNESGIPVTDRTMLLESFI